jgi:hypothetical protein
MDVYDSAGVDLTLIRWMLSLTPSERLDVLQEFVDFVTEARKRNGIQPIPGYPAYAGQS